MQVSFSRKIFIHFRSILAKYLYTYGTFLLEICDKLVIILSLIFPPEKVLGLH